MTTIRFGRGRVAQKIHLLVACLVAALLAVISLAGAGPLPALGYLLTPGNGVWTDAASADLPTNQTIELPGLDGKVSIGFEKSGTPHIKAGSDADMFTAMGYLHSTFRLFQMDLMRRQAAGRLAEIVGPEGVASDAYELDVGLARAAERDWKTMSPNSPAYNALVDYSAGVNNAMEKMQKSGTLPMYFKLLGYEPKPWTPVDSLLVQRLLTQTLSMDMRPMTFTVLAEAIGKKTFDTWFPAAPWNKQHPFDPGPYEKVQLKTLPVSDPAAPNPEPPNIVDQSGAAKPASAIPALTDGGSIPVGSTALADVMLKRIAGLPANAIHTFGNSNVWVVAGSKTASGKPILASDPHLSLTLPSTWFQVSALSPGYHMTGVSLPGLPVVLIGKTDTISFGIANSQHNSTFFYLEKTSLDKPDQYFWKGDWRPMSKVTYSIKVKGAPSVKHVVRLTVHGPIVTDQGITASMWWVGALPSDNLNSALKMVKATTFAEFRSALAGWGTPAEDFAYADRAGNIGIVNAGYAPQIASGSPYLPMSGTGESDVIGTVPPAALPVTYNPPEGFAGASNQREVGVDYPYYFGRGYDFFDQGWRQNEIVKSLSGATGVTMQQTQQLQMSAVDGVAREFAPTVIAAMAGQKLTDQENSALELLTNWNYSLDTDSAAATIWLAYVRLYEYSVFMPWWKTFAVPAPARDELTPSKDHGGYALESLRGMLVTLSASDPGNNLFTGSNGAGSSAVTLMRLAFKETVASLAKKSGPSPASWTYGKTHLLLIESLLQNTTLDAGPYEVGSGGRAINSVLGHTPTRDGRLLTGVTSGGASWRLVIDWGTGQAVSSYPGGTSENPASPWYANGVDGWLAGRYEPLLDEKQANKLTKGRTWTLTA